MNSKFLYTPGGERTLSIIHTGSVASVKSLDIYREAQDVGFKIQSIIPTQSSLPFVIESFLRECTKENSDGIRQKLSQKESISQEEFLKILQDIGGVKQEIYLQLFQLGEQNLSSSFGKGVREIAHITASRVGSILLAPASANTLSKIAQGITDSFALEVIRAFNPQNGGRVFIAPAMNTYMLSDPAIKRNLRILTSSEFASKYVVLGTQEKTLACGETGYGAMLHPREIAEKMRHHYQTRGIQPGTKKIYGQNSRVLPQDDSTEKYREILGQESVSFPLRGYNFEIPRGDSQNAFGGLRKYDIHTGIDLFADEGNSVFSILDGEVVYIEKFTGPNAEPPSNWWNETEAIFIKTKIGIILYGELIPCVRVGDTVSAGQKIGELKSVLKENRDTGDIALPPSMLHIELYENDFPIEKGGVIWNYAEGTQEKIPKEQPEGLKNPLAILEYTKIYGKE